MSAPGGEAATRRLRVVLADDHPVFLGGLEAALEGHEDLEVVGTARDTDEAVTQAARLEPDVVLMDLRMPGGGGVVATARLLAECPGTAVVMLTMSEDDDSVFAALRAGARGYLLKEADSEAIIDAVKAVARGEAVFGPRVADRVLAFFAGAGSRRAAVPFAQLTEREREVLDLVAQGHDNATIARRLFLSDKTVRNHVSACLTKLHAASRAEAVAMARDAGLGDG